MESPKVEIESQSCVVANGLTSDLNYLLISQSLNPSSQAYRGQRVKFMSQLVKAKSWLTGTI